MNYQKIYDSLIQKRIDHPLYKNNCYCEKHHIIPKSLGGTNDYTNLINLTAREHYIAHLLLWKKYKQMNNKNSEIKMLCALIRLSTGNSEFKNNCKIKFESRLYEQIKAQFSQAQKNRLSGTKKFHNKEGKIINVSFEESQELDMNVWFPGTGLKPIGLLNHRYIRNVNTNEVKLIKNNKQTPIGWIDGGYVNKPNNTCWINNGIVNKKIKRDEPIPSGFKYGIILSQKFKKVISGITKGTLGRKLITNTQTNSCKFIKEEDINKYIFDGSCWVIGRLEPRLMSEKARINNTIGKLKRSYPSLDISKLDITHYRKLSKIKRQEYIKSLLTN